MNIAPSQGSMSIEREPWIAEDKDVYPLKLLKYEERDNKFYLTPDQLDQEYGKRPDGQKYWEDKKGNKVFHDPEDATQFLITFEIIGGGKHSGEWVSVFARKWYTIDGKGKLAIIAKAIDTDYDLSKGVDLDALISDLCRGSIEPKKSDTKYGHITEFLPMRAADKAKYKAQDEAVAKVIEELGGEEIPF